MPLGGPREIAATDGKVFTMDDEPGNGHCFFGCVQKGLVDLQQGVALPAHKLREAKEMQKGDGHMAAINVGALEMKVYSWRLTGGKNGFTHYVGQRITESLIVVCVMAGPVSLTYHKYLPHFIPH